MRTPRGVPGLPASPAANPHRVGHCRTCGVHHDQGEAVAEYARHLGEPCHGDVVLFVAAGGDPAAFKG